MAAKLSTHVLDAAAGGPAAGVALRLYRRGPDGKVFLKADVTNADGRTDAPLLEGAAVERGEYELVFDAGDYLAATHPGLLADPPFLNRVRIGFAMAEGGSYHVPLILSPHGYSTYRGS
jgi:5-hydroxyisourate hydrolase